MSGWKKTSAMIGVSTFLATHVVEVANWRTFDTAGAYSPWFLNSTRGIVFTAISLFAAAVVEGTVAARDRRDAGIRGVSLASGAAAAMAAVLFWRGAGTIFPIALAFGAGIAAASALAGELVGWGVNRLARGRAS